jgi:uncharacterized protein (DUF433 family)
MTSATMPCAGQKEQPSLRLFFTEAQAARLSHLSISTVRSWQRQDIVRLASRPEGTHGPHSRLYDYFGIVTLRLLSQLRKELQVPLEELRKTAHYLRSLGEDPWDRTIHVLNREVLFEPTGEDYLVSHSGQRTYLDLSVVEQETRRDVQLMLRRPSDTIGHISRQRNILGNATTIQGTRVRTSSIDAFHRAGYSIDQIIAEYPDLTAEDVAAAIAYERQQRIPAA